MKLTYRKFQVTTIIILLFILAISKSGDLFVQFLIKPELQAFEKQYSISIQYKTILLKSLHTVQIKRLTITSDGSEPVIKAGSINIKVNTKSLLSKKINLQKLEADKVDVYLIKDKDASNFDFLYRQAFNQEAASTPSGDSDYAAKVEKILKAAFGFMPSNTDVSNLKVTCQYEEDWLTLDIPTLSIKDNTFLMEIRNKEHGVEDEWVCSGSIRDEKQQMSLRFYTKDTTKKMILPFIEEKWGADIRFDTLAFELSRRTKQPGIQTLRGKAGVKGLLLYHKLISSDTLLLNRGFMNYNIDIGKNFLEIDSSKTTIYFNKLKLSPYIKIEKKDDWHARAALDKKDIPAGDFFSSIPKGMFHHVEGLEAEGLLNYHFFLDVDMTKVENLRFESTLQSKNFRILRYGNTDLRKMNNSFSHTIYDRGRPVRTFRLGYENPDFRPYRSISRYLPYAIMHAEDAGFMHHAGFIPDAFRRSLVQDIIEKRFARGGSTLSMQLVKNVFLSHDKTISRKLEEIMIVWLIETCRLTSKQRMFEVYMNVIEWGPNVYGVTEAARYYFAKEPSELNLGESVFLSYIIFAPKHVRSHFSGTQIRPAFYVFYRDAVKRLLQRNWITPEEATKGNPNIIIRGPFREKLE